MIAVDASTVDAALTVSVISTPATSGMYFVKADAAGKKLLVTGFTKAQVEAATFIVLNPKRTLVSQAWMLQLVKATTLQL